MIQTKEQSLRRHLNSPKWLTTIGLGEIEGVPCFFIYTNNLSLARKAEVPKNWEGIPIEIKYMKSLHPV
jgi:hypothetical protein